MARYASIPELGPGVFGADLAKGEIPMLSERCRKLRRSVWLIREMCDLACIGNVPCSAHDGLRCNRQGADPEFWHEYSTVPRKIVAVGFATMFAALAEWQSVRSVNVDPLLKGPVKSTEDVDLVSVNVVSSEEAAAVATEELSTMSPPANGPNN
ncbi:hypothetical protein LPJ59_000073 [Coemansia sp. RSA 2399]|nr:hypothetical protein LPJ59_000073 [Coemansia sp. RSA 2399]KAJ1908463.1 hypothetical protein LPJ81_000079 [Coemansia sp. IMI 209127]